ncbi:MAG: hypothetical protein EBR81_17685, partial [Proteobacteria bacterium]|nr:hypothetical protein [Pseudomonadota bacterium]
TSGGLLRSGNVALLIGGSADFGRLTAGGTSGSVPLYVYNNQSTLSLNSRIIDNPAGGSVQLVLSGAASTFNLGSTANSYSGGTVLNNVTLALNNTGGVPVVPTGGLVLNSATVTMTNNSGQIASGNTVTLNGPSTLTLLGNNTLANLILNNIGGNAPVVNTGGVLSLTSGSVTATSSNVYQSASLSTGAIDFGTSTGVFNVGAVLVGTQNVAPMLSTLTIAGAIRGTGGITVTGGGVLQLNAMSGYTGTTLVGADSTLQYGLSASGSPASALVLATATSRLSLNNNSDDVGSLAGAGVVFNNSTTARTLTAGWDNTSTTFSGQFARFNDATSYNNNLNFTKVGTGRTSNVTTMP